jgi:hypothetical protein
VWYWAGHPDLHSKISGKLRIVAVDENQKIDVKRALRVFEKVTQKGSKDDDGWHYGGLTVNTDFDGYTVFIRSNKVDLTIFFHNKYSVDCASERDLQEFVGLLAKLDRD